MLEWAGASDVGSMQESRCMELARLQNLSMQRKLRQTLSVLQHDWKMYESRINIEKKFIQRHLEEMCISRHGRKQRLVLPRGLSPRQVQMIKERREQENTASITLQQFDKKMHRLKDKRTFYRTLLEECRTNPRKKKYLPADIIERCHKTNVHLNLLQRPDEKDHALQREPSLLAQLPKQRLILDYGHPHTPDPDPDYLDTTKDYGHPHIPDPDHLDSKEEEQSLPDICPGKKQSSAEVGRASVCPHSTLHLPSLSTGTTGSTNNRHKSVDDSNTLEDVLLHIRQLTVA